MQQLTGPILVAPMAGGPSTPALVVGAARAGAPAFLAAGYQAPASVEDQLRTVTAAGFPYGLNIFVPMDHQGDPRAVERYRDVLQVEAERYGVELPAPRPADDDHFAAKVELATAYRVPVVSFTFGVPQQAVVDALHAAGTQVLITVTTADEARQALTVHPDGLIAQAGTAGAHSSTTQPADHHGDSTADQVLAAVRAVAEMPVVVAGGTASAADVARLLGAGAAAVQCGTAFLLADEAGTRPAHREALTSGRFQDTVVTRAFTGQPARGLRNRFTETYSAVAPVGYPAVHHLTAPIRAAAAERGDADALNLWAGTGFTAARPGPVADLIDALRP
ncbi:nitronate monooxygenase [Actinoplanes sp. N902-109]|uniref:nitronate monooxygenase n=1 Tax=Actinoplanes sp. (strain N902-109) TaxID=649831 RepID=UPI0003294A9D|nr:nitronate monooxygenase [Actinoplanes sp. N902-109]AGL17210.1 2-nitropropane dioxygenase NPD [Actinoplanes sp. N902-109]